MAARLNPQQDQRARSAIQTTQLVKRLQQFVFNQKDEAGNDVEIDSARLRAIEVLLRKSLPDLQAITLETGSNGFKIQIGGSDTGVL